MNLKEMKIGQTKVIASDVKTEKLLLKFYKIKEPLWDILTVKGNTVTVQFSPAPGTVWADTLDISGDKVKILKSKRTKGDEGEPLLL